MLALAFVGPALLPGRALLPIDALFGYPPWQAHAENFGISLPHNPLIADAILQNYSWKRLARESFAAGELPLWNPYILAGQPFMASGQNGSLYPLGVLFYVLPLASAYGWFIALHLWIGALGACWLARMLGATRLGGVIAGADVRVLRVPRRQLPLADGREHGRLAAGSCWRRSSGRSSAALASPSGPSPSAG